MKTENELIRLAEQHPDDKVAKKAMKELRTKFDKTYGWCNDCDGLVCKEKDCCLNRLDIDDVSKNEVSF
jgi:hypothetical protein